METLWTPATGELAALCTENCICHALEDNWHQISIFSTNLGTECLLTMDEITDNYRKLLYDDDDDDTGKTPSDSTLNKKMFH